jgi:putative flippase GtrA/glycosyltransferase involved in cell wall biosynthesis
VTAGPRASDPGHVVVDVVVPVYNEEADLGPSVRRLHAYLELNLPVPFRITIADNASTDRTWAIAEELADTLPHVAAYHLDEKGRGRALKAVWSASDADVLAYMDVDLSTDLAAVLPLVAPLLSGHSDLSIGSRLTRQSRVVRGPKRELISRSYNLILRTTLAARFSDAQCGFKAIRADRARELLPLVEDTGWFFDTELLVLAERAGLRIHEVPVDWTDDPDSRVDIVSTAVADLRGIVRLARGMASGRIPITSLPSYRGADVPPRLGRQLVRFALVGVLSTLAYLVLYLALRGAMDAQLANAAALLLTAIGNTALNRRLTFGVRGSTDRFRHQLQGLVVFGIGLALTSFSLSVLHSVSATPARWVEVAVLVAANVGATLVRFLLFRSWVFPRRTELPAQPDRRSSS